MNSPLQIDQKLTFNVLHILNHGRISKIDKNIHTLVGPPSRHDRVAIKSPDEDFHKKIEYEGGYF